MKLNVTDFIKTATETAEHFGFQHIDDLKEHPTCKNCYNKLSNTASAQDRKQDDLHGLLTGGINHYADSRLNALEKPVSFFTVERVPRSGEAAVTLHVFRASKSVAEAMLIHTSRALLNDLGYPDSVVRVNSLGDKDSAQRYNRELTNFLRKRLGDLPVNAREQMKEHVRYALKELIDTDHELSYRSPSPLEYLSDPSRKHFREVVEYLDLTETPYEIDPRLMGHHNCYSDTLFQIDVQHEAVPVHISGGRYSHFTAEHFENEVPVAGAVIILKDSKFPARTPKITPAVRPAVHLVHLGFSPKIQSLRIVDDLRRKGFVVHHDFTNDSLSEQLRNAEAGNARYTLILGQKEFVDGTIILRDMEARTQESIPQDAVAGRLKRNRAKIGV